MSLLRNRSGRSKVTTIATIGWVIILGRVRKSYSTAWEYCSKNVLNKIIVTSTIITKIFLGLSWNIVCSKYTFLSGVRLQSKIYTLHTRLIIVWISLIKWFKINQLSHSCVLRLLQEENWKFYYATSLNVSKYVLYVLF